MKKLLYKYLLVSIISISALGKAYAVLVPPIANTNGVTPAGSIKGGQSIAVVGVSLKSLTGTTSVTSFSFSCNQTIANYFTTANMSVIRVSSYNGTYVAGDPGNAKLAGTFSVSSGTLTFTSSPAQSVNTTGYSYFLVVTFDVGGPDPTPSPVNFNFTLTQISGSAIAPITGYTYSWDSPATMTITSNNVPAFNGIQSDDIYYTQQGICVFGFSITVSNSRALVSQIALSAMLTGNAGNPFFATSDVYLVENDGTDYSSGTNTPIATTNTVGNPTNIVNISPNTPLDFNASPGNSVTRNFFVYINFNSYFNKFPNAVYFYLQPHAVAYTELSGGTSFTNQTVCAPQTQVTGYTIGFKNPTITFTGQNVIGTGTGANNITPVNLTSGQTGVVLYGFSLNNAGSQINITSLRLTPKGGSGGSNFASYFTNLKLYRSPTSVFNAATATPITATLAVGTTAVNFNSIPSEAIGFNQTLYYFVVADWTLSGPVPNTLQLTYNTAGTVFSDATGVTSSPVNPDGQIFLFGIDYYDWTGNVSTDWNNAGNWLKNGTAGVGAPGITTVTTDYVRIGVSSYAKNNNPVNNTTASLKIGNLEIGSLGSTAASAAPVIIDLRSKNINIYAGLKVNSGATLTLNNSSTAATSSFSLGTSASSTTVSTIASTALINFATGTNPVTLNKLGGTATLMSDASGSATIGTIPTGSSVVGTFNVQRYMSGGNGRRGYRLLSSPITTSAFNSGVKGFTLVALQNTTPITGWGVVGNYTFVPPNASFDYSNTGSPSALFYYEPDADPNSSVIAKSDYKGFNTIGEMLPVGNGFLFFFRGNRNVTDANGTSKVVLGAVPESTVLNYTGSINQGDVQVYIPTSPLTTSSATTAKVYQGGVNATASTTLSYTNNSSTSDGFNLVGNPYPATIDLDKLTTTVFTNPYSTFANYVYIMNNSGVMSAYEIGSNSGLLNGVGRYISPGQGFFVRGSAAGSTLKFTESMKVTSGYTSPTSFNVVNNNTQSQAIKIRLGLDSTNFNETLIRFGNKNAHNKYSANEDAKYKNGLSQTTFMASYSSDNQPCLINQMGALDSIKSIPLYAEGQTTGTYTMSFSGASTIDPRFKLYLKDNLTKDSIDLSAKDTYTFKVDRANAATYGSARFKLVVRSTNIEKLYQLLSFEGAKDNNGVVLKWAAQYEGDYTTFTVQRSTDGFKTHTDLDKQQSTGVGLYAYTDTKPVANAVNEYRLVQNNINNINSFSDVVKVSYVNAVTVNANTGKLEVYPNPVISALQLKFSPDANSGSVYLKIYNIKGDLLINGTFDANSKISQDVSKLIQGNYVLHLSDNKKDYGSVTFTKL